MNRQFIPSLNAHSAVRSWEISPCREMSEYDGGQVTEAFETQAEADAIPDDVGIGPTFWGVYINLRESAIADGQLPAIHLRDFDTYDEALSFVTVLNGVPEMTFSEEDE